MYVKKTHYKPGSPKLMHLPLGDDQVQVTYVWIDGTVLNMRSKCQTLNFEPKCASELPVWNYDGSSTYQTQGLISDLYLHPVALYKDPFRGGKNKLVLCETYNYDSMPTESNNRSDCAKVMEIAKAHEPWFGIEQEYTLFHPHSDLPLGWPEDGSLPPQGPYYCSVGASVSFGREIVEDHYRACLYAGIKLCGINAEVMPSQWEFQVGPSEGISVCDDIWMARYILARVAETHNADVSFDPKPKTGDWNGAGAHTNFSTKLMREENGIEEIYKAIEKLRPVHIKHIAAYDPNQGRDNARRLTGTHETASIHTFSHGVASRQASIRIPRNVDKEGKGYLEDRRPSSNCDPYKVTQLLVETICL